MLHEAGMEVQRPVRSRPFGSRRETLTRVRSFLGVEHGVSGVLTDDLTEGDFWHSGVCHHLADDDRAEVWCMSPCRAELELAGINWQWPWATCAEL